MDHGNKVHPRYAGLPETAINSEVMASKYAAEVSKLGNEEDREYIICAMEEWAKHFRNEGLTVADKHLVVFGELSLVLQNAGKGDLAGKVAIVFSDALKAAIYEGRATAVGVEKLELIAETFLRGIDGLKKATETLTSAVPKKHLKALRRTKPIPHLGSKTSDPGSSKTTDNKEEPEETPDHNAPQDTPPGPEPNPEAMEEVEEDILPKKAPKLTPEQVEALRGKVRVHYSDTEFESFTETKKMALIYYYIEHILGVSRPLVDQDPKLRQMLFDIIDKRRAIRVCGLARAGTFTFSDMTDAIEEAVEAIATCNHLYGNYVGEMITNGQTPLLVITEGSSQ